jgi:flagellar basal-body rod modification protein FlgD
MQMNIQGFIPAIAAPVLGLAASAVKAATSSTSSTSGTAGTGNSAASLQDTFLNLLVTELQNQDPTSPVDPTQMVSQMVSLNQLDQLISINQTLSGMTTDPSGTTGTSGTSGISGSSSTSGANQTTPTPAGRAISTLQTNPSTAAAANQLPAAPAYAAGNSGLMNLYGSYAVPKAIASYPTYTGVR